VSSLGILWSPEKNILSLKIGSDWAGIKKPTKRLVLAYIAKTFDI